MCAPYEGLLALGAYNHLLPTAVRRCAVVEQFGVERFVEAVARLRTERKTEAVAENLKRLILTPLVP